MTAPRLPSIRGRLARTLAIVSLAWGLAVTAAVWVVVRHEVDELMDLTLRESAEILHGVLAFSAAALPQGAVHGAALQTGSRQDHLAWQLVDQRGQVLLRSHTAPETLLRTGWQTGFSDGVGEWRIYGQPFPRAAPAGSPARMLFVAQHDSERREARLEASLFTILAALLVGLACALGLRWLLRRELVPLADLSEAVRSHDPLRPQAPLPPARRAELAPLHYAISDLAQRLARRVASERAFSAHAAHALRTPLAGLDVQLAVALRECPPALQPRLQRSREAVARLRGVVQALLMMFRSGSEPVREPVVLSDLFSHLPVEGLTVEAPAAVTVQADPDLLAAALLNLLDNAQRHGARQVQVTAASSPQGLRLRLQDDGPGIEPATRQRLQDAIDAQDYAALPGLGLMLADLVARAHGGRLTLQDGGAGCTVELLLGP
jgi:signal transduction histidine kinase